MEEGSPGELMQLHACGARCNDSACVGALTHSLHITSLSAQIRANHSAARRASVRSVGADRWCGSYVAVRASGAAAGSAWRPPEAQASFTLLKL